MAKRQSSPGRRIDVAITREIIDLSTQRDSSHCMIAEAVRAAVPGAKLVSVDLATIRLTDPNTRKRYVYLTPRRAQLALLDFDQGRAPEPFTLQLRPAQIVPVRQQIRGTRKKTPRGPAQLARPVEGNVRSVPVKTGGHEPPLGALASGAQAKRTGRIRRFGLRAMEA